jgi:predicted alpha/beta-fold hydrolase
MFMYSVSLGGTAATRYLIEDAENTPIKAALFFGAPVSLDLNHDFFEQNLYGIYNKVMGASFIKGQRKNIE